MSDRLPLRARQILAQNARDNLRPEHTARVLRDRRHGPKKKGPAWPPPRLHSGKKGIVDWQYAMMPHTLAGAGVAALADVLDGKGD